MKQAAKQQTTGGEKRRAMPPAVWIALVVAGIVLAQIVLIGPSLVGQKILLPLDFLAMPGVYSPHPPNTPPTTPHNSVYSDLVLSETMAHEFLVAEFQAGRWPLWMPNTFCGSPFLYTEFSPFKLPLYCSASPKGYAWPPLLVAVFTGLGAYFFCRRVLQTGPWPATIAAWCWPLTGFFVFWMDYNMTFSVGWLPWLLWAVDATVRRKSPWAGLWLVPATCMTIISGQFDVGAEVLLVSGLYAIWCFIDEYGRQCFTTRRALPALAAIVAGWGLGLVLTSVHLLPMIEYSRYSSRLERRSQGKEERPPIGIDALPQIVLPDMYGSWQEGYVWAPPIDERTHQVLEGNQPESPSAAYAGLLATVLLMPLAWCSRRHRSINICLVILAVLGVAWDLNLPIVVSLMRLPGLNMLSYNRFVFTTSFCILAMMAVGLDVLWRGEARWRWWFWGPVAVLTIMFLWCGYSSATLPEEIARQIKYLEGAVRNGYWVAGISDHPEGVDRVRSTFVLSFSVATMLCIAALGGWLLIGLGGTSRRWFLPAICGILLADLVWFAYGRATQCNPALYYPRIPALEQVARAEPGRIVGYHCLPAILGQSHNLRDVRGYDGIDPTRIVDLLQIAADRRSVSPDYAATQWLMPQVGFSPSGDIRLHPVLDMLGVRYVIFRGNPPPQLHPEFVSPDYWVMKNLLALPRVFVPERVELASDERERLKKLASNNFDPRQVAYVEEPVDLPAECRGTAQIVDEIPTRIKISVEMETAGLVVLSDRWDAGWHAYYNGKPVPMLQTNHAVRGVVAPVGKGTLEFRYEPRGFAWSLRLCAGALAAMIVWAGAIVCVPLVARKSSAEVKAG